MAEKIFIVSGTPFFSDATIDSQVLFVSPTDAEYEVKGKRKYFITKNPAINKESHPLMIGTYFYEIPVNADKTVWVSPDLQFSQQYNIVIPRPVPGAVFQYLTLAAAVVLLLSIYFLYKRFDIGKLLKNGKVWPAKAVILALVIIIFLRFFLLLLTFSMSGEMLLNPVDENGYFKVTSYLLDGNYDGTPWIYTIGLGILYYPLALILKAKSYYDIVLAISYIVAFVIVPATFTIFYFIIQKVTKSSRGALLATGIWAFLPFLYFPVELHAEGLIKTIFTLPEFSTASYYLYYIYHSCGFNGLSDSISVFFIFAAVLLVLYMRPGIKMCVLVSVLYGYSCVLRMNNVLFAPLLAYLYWYQLKDEFKNYFTFFKLLLISLASFSVIMAMQLYVNDWQLGSFLKTPYSLHNNNAAEGFSLGFLLEGTRFLFNGNYAYMVLGTTGLIYLKNSNIRKIIVLLTIPLLLYFSGYVVVGNNPIRFILPVYYGFLLAFVSYEEWYSLKKWQVLAGIFIIVINIIFISPCSRLSAPYSFNINNYDWGYSVNLVNNILIPLFSLTGSIIIFKENKRFLYFIVTFLLLFYSSFSYLIQLILILILMQTCYVVLRDFYLWGKAFTQKTPGLSKPGVE